MEHDQVSCILDSDVIIIIFFYSSLSQKILMHEGCLVCIVYPDKLHMQ